MSLSSFTSTALKSLFKLTDKKDGLVAKIKKIESAVEEVVATPR